LEDKYCRGLDVKWRDDLFESGIASAGTVQGYGTKVFWGAHPRAFRMKGWSDEEMCGKIGDVLGKV
jgi:hypothetical protein